MVFLVQFIEDDIFHICSAKHFKQLRGGYVAKWSDNKYYPAKILCKSDFKTLKGIVSNLNKGMPQVMMSNVQQKDDTFFSVISSHEQDVRSDISINSHINIQTSATNETAQAMEQEYVTDNEQYIPSSDLSIAMQNSIIFLNEEEINQEISSSDTYILQTGNDHCTPHMNLAINVESENMDTTQHSHQQFEERIEKESNLQTSNDQCTSYINLPINVESENMDITEPFHRLEGRIEKESNLQTNIPGDRNGKKHCCFYCHKMVFKVHRHYLSVHKNEKEVREIAILPPKNQHRVELLDDLRKQGDFIYNSQLKNEEDDALVCKRSKYADEVCCPNCKGYYNKYSIRKHMKNCVPNMQKLGARQTIQPECRKMDLKIHSKASEALKTRIVPYMNPDAITKIILYDEAVIQYGNYLCRKYTAHHNSAQIRSHMRNFGRLLLAIRDIDASLQSFLQVLDANNVNIIIEGIETVAGINPDNNIYRAPATALTLGTELRKLCRLLQMEYVKSDNKECQKKMKNLLIVFESEFNVTINRKGLESQRIIKRRKKTVLPKTTNIAQFREYLENKIIYFTKALTENFSKPNWTHLVQYTLVHLAVFNRKRPGETQRLLIEDFRNYEVIEDNEIEENDFISKEQVKKWARVKFTGKLGRDNALLIHRELGFQAIELILKYREAAGVQVSNPYIFGEPSPFHYNITFKACALIRKLAHESGIEDSELIRTRLLRQHLATETASINVEQRLESRVSDFMAHQKKIHDDYYVLTKKRDDITKVSTLLENFSSRSKVPDQNVASTSGISNQPSASTPSASHNLSNLSSSNSETELSQAEINFVLGKKGCRLSWTTDEKQAARKAFHDEIYSNKKISLAKVKWFHKERMGIFHNRSPHLIRQWIVGERKRYWKESKGINSSRQRWTTPEKEALEESVTNHSLEFSLPSVADCELLISENPVLKNRSPACIKSFMYNSIKKRSSV